jgi:hypothetical protein
MKAFIGNPTATPLKQHYHLISDLPHLLKPGCDRMPKSASMVVGFDTSSQELKLEHLIVLLVDDLSPIVFSDDPITKMYDSLPIVLGPIFRPLNPVKQGNVAQKCSNGWAIDMVTHRRLLRHEVHDDISQSAFEAWSATF